jgi:hypothetical protein
VTRVTARRRERRAVVKGLGRQHEVDVLHNLCGTLWRSPTGRGGIEVWSRRARPLPRPTR